MTFDYICHLTQEEVENLSQSPQWAGKYHWFTAIGDKKDKAEPLREQWKSQYLQTGQAPDINMASRDWDTSLGLSPVPGTVVPLDTLPSLSFAICLKFRLQTPYLSRGDNEFHIIDNPIVREKVFGWPMVRSSAWKGSLRHTLWQLGAAEDDERIQRIFGEIRSDDSGRAGRLRLYPSFFEQGLLEIINPQDRQVRAGKNPILFECVPAKATSVFALQYIPFDAEVRDESRTVAEVSQDLEVLAEGIEAMFTTYGFGAKTGSGFGRACDSLAGEGSLAIGASLPEMAPSAAPETSEVIQADPCLPRYQESPTRLHADFRRPDGSLKSEAEYRVLIQGRGQQYARKDRLLYGKARGWWEREGRELAESAAEQPTPESEPADLKAPPVSTYPFRSLSELYELAQRVAAQLGKGGAA